LASIGLLIWHGTAHADTIDPGIAQLTLLVLSVHWWSSMAALCLCPQRRGAGALIAEIVFDFSCSFGD